MLPIILQNAKNQGGIVFPIFFPIVPHIVTCISLFRIKISKFVSLPGDIVENNLLEPKKEGNARALPNRFLQNVKYDVRF